MDVRTRLLPGPRSKSRFDDMVQSGGLEWQVLGIEVVANPTGQCMGRGRQKAWDDPGVVIHGFRTESVMNLDQFWLMDAQRPKLRSE